MTFINKNLKRAGFLLTFAFGLMILTGIDAKAQYNRNDNDNDDY